MFLRYISRHKQVSKLVFYARPTGTVISGRWHEQTKYRLFIWLDKCKWICEDMHTCKTWTHKVEIVYIQSKVVWRLKMCFCCWPAVLLGFLLIVFNHFSRKLTEQLLFLFHTCFRHGNISEDLFNYWEMLRCFIFILYIYIYIYSLRVDHLWIDDFQK